MSRSPIFYSLNFVRTATFMISPLLIRAREIRKDVFDDLHARQLTQALCSRHPNDVVVQLIVACYTGDSSFVNKVLDSNQSISKTALADPYTQVNIHNLKALLLTCLAIVYNPSKSFATQAPHLICAL